MLAVVTFYKPHKECFHFVVDQDRPAFIKDTELWSMEREEPCIVPAQNITGRFVAGTYQLETIFEMEKCLAVIPFAQKMYI